MNNPQDYVFSNNWFSGNRPVWDALMPMVKPQKLLEIGSYEGASACYLIETLAAQHPIELHCVDTWEGGVEHQPGGLFQADMASVEQRFFHNIELARSRSAQAVDLHVHKARSDTTLARLIAQGERHRFDFVYLDGSHQAPDVLSDAVLSFKLLRVGGVVVFDDYTWHEDLPYGKDPLRCPKMAIDAFVACNFRKTQIIPAPLGQLYVQKLAD